MKPKDLGPFPCQRAHRKNAQFGQLGLFHLVRELGSRLVTNGILQDLLEFVIPG